MTCEASQNKRLAQRVYATGRDRSRVNPTITRLAASFYNISTAATAVLAKLDPQNGAAPSSHVVLFTCVKYLYSRSCYQELVGLQGHIRRRDPGYFTRMLLDMDIPGKTHMNRPHFRWIDTM